MASQVVRCEGAESDRSEREHSAERQAGRPKPLSSSPQQPAPDALRPGGCPERPDLLCERLHRRAQLSHAALERRHERHARDGDARALGGGFGPDDTREPRRVLAGPREQLLAVKVRAVVAHGLHLPLQPDVVACEPLRVLLQRPHEAAEGDHLLREGLLLAKEERGDAELGLRAAGLLLLLLRRGAAAGGGFVAGGGGQAIAVAEGGGGGARGPRGRAGELRAVCSDDIGRDGGARRALRRGELRPLRAAGLGGLRGAHAGRRHLQLLQLAQLSLCKGHRRARRPSVVRAEVRLADVLAHRRRNVHLRDAGGERRRDSVLAGWRDGLGNGGFFPTADSAEYAATQDEVTARSAAAHNILRTSCGGGLRARRSGGRSYRVALIAADAPGVSVTMVVLTVVLSLGRIRSEKSAPAFLADDRVLQVTWSEEPRWRPAMRQAAPRALWTPCNGSSLDLHSLKAGHHAQETHHVKNARVVVLCVRVLKHRLKRRRRHTGVS